MLQNLASPQRERLIEQSTISAGWLRQMVWSTSLMQYLVILGSQMTQLVFYMLFHKFFLIAYSIYNRRSIVTVKIRSCFQREYQFRGTLNPPYMCVVVVLFILTQHQGSILTRKTAGLSFISYLYSTCIIGQSRRRVLIC